MEARRKAGGGPCVVDEVVEVGLRGDGPDGLNGWLVAVVSWRIDLGG